MSKAESEMIKAVIAGTAAESGLTKEFNLAVEDLREWFNEEKAKGENQQATAMLAIGYIYAEITA